MRLALAFATSLLLASAAATAQAVSFARDVLPILSDRCFTCHGPDAAARKAGLRLDEQKSVFQQRDGRAAVVPGKPEQSELLRRITAHDDSVMPPRDSNLTLSPTEIATLERWIAQGARWTRHWSFAPPASIDIPAPEPSDWVGNEIDAFVLRKLKGVGVQPSPPAEPAALLRRVHLDLTGLPPTPEQLDAFEADPSDAAYRRVVDDLLSSPHYGERMAWPWLEASRYADTDGFQNDPTRTAWPWRDWLVQTLNDNLPFDDFTVQVLAGDLLPEATPEQRLASGFLRNNPHNGEGGRIAEETRIENIFDRTETVGTVWMGMTWECARCHDHKYDPISQRDYYGLFAFFDQTSETGRGRSGGKLAPTMRYVGNRKVRAQIAALDERIARLQQTQTAADPELDRKQLAWQDEQRRKLLASEDALQPAALGGWLRSHRFEPPAKGPAAMFATAYAPETQRDIRAGEHWRPAAGLVDGKVHTFPEGAYTEYFHRTITAPTPRRMRISLGSDDAIKVWCNGELVLQNDTRRGARPDQERAELALRAGENHVLVKIVNTGGLGGMYFRVLDESDTDLPLAILQALRTDPAKRTAAHKASLQRHHRMRHVDGYAARDRDLLSLRSERDRLAGRGLDVSIMDELPADKRRTTYILDRGDYQSRKQAVEAGTPTFLPPLQAERNDRLALARWLVSGKHPLTARVAVNRAWQTLFGRGLVATSEDFGRQGERPTHPELLDWLAGSFVASGWDLKQLHRLIVTSNTYRQSAAGGAGSYRDDPDNRLLARSARHRLPSWMLRDQALSLSGRIDATLGGEPVRPYQPDGIWAEATFGQIRYRRDQGNKLYRRSLYVFWRRIVGPTMLFDTQARQACVVRRSTTNTPLHALTTLNETGFVESARGLATRAWRAANDDSGRIAWLFRAATARHPSDRERQLLEARLDATVAHFTDAPDRARQLLAVGEATAAKDIPVARLAAMTVVASIVLNLDEVLTRP